MAAPLNRSLRPQACYFDRVSVLWVQLYVRWLCMQGEGGGVRTLGRVCDCLQVTLNDDWFDIRSISLIYNWNYRALWIFIVNIMVMKQWMYVLVKYLYFCNLIIIWAIKCIIIIVPMLSEKFMVSGCRNYSLWNLICFKHLLLFK